MMESAILLVVIFLFLVSAIAVVFLLMTLNLTVSTGILIYYSQTETAQALIFRADICNDD